MEPAERKALKIYCRGIVQGVGFRPFVHNLAEKLGIKGWVLNSSQGVEIHAEGKEENLRAFVREIKENPPPLARITQFSVEETQVLNFNDFTIKASEKEERGNVLVPPDTAVCSDCRRDIFDPQSRYYMYPFTNCTNCGPRFTIVRDFPYDRVNTTMSVFEMCEQCRNEYSDPLNRRFHAQPTACPRCGPKVFFTDSRGNEIQGSWREKFFEAILEGKIVAVKGLGGFHLACNALDGQAVKRLRDKKNRPFKPLAVMARDLDVVKEYCVVGGEEEKLFLGTEAPIVVLNKKQGTGLPEELSPNLGTLGVMPPYTPLHLMLFNEDIKLLVMTSGNPQGLPLEKDNAEALQSLGFVADYFLMHERDIENRNDDSVVRVVENKITFLRRSRGYVPRPINVPVDPLLPKTVLGIGGEMKNAFCILKPNGEAFVSQHMGELDTLESMENLRESIVKFERFLEVKPEIVAYDMHPGYNSSRFAREMEGFEKTAVQHHHAHMAACMAENYVKEPVIGVIMDGTGYGLDGKIWGCEFLSGDYTEFKRHAHLKYIPLIGGERAVINPWIITFAYLKEYLGERGVAIAKQRFRRDKEIDTALKILENKINCPETSSAGRFFDAVSAFLGVCQEATYEGQPAIELGELAGKVVKTDLSYGSMLKDFPEEEPCILDPGGIIKGMVADWERGISREEISTKFHNSFIETIVDTVEKISRKTGIRTVALSGGVFHNEYILTRAISSLEERNYRVLTHTEVPFGDGGISLGQALVAYWRWHKNVSVIAGEGFKH
ncbi:MAG: carbamoyltransferase HypF [Clostridia bacterium]|nr:carbamoyltransferase HypF [Clostridia bacterium]